MTYRDSTGTGTSAFVRARLYRMPVGKTNTNVLAEVHSDGFSDTSTVLHTSEEFNHSFDFGGNVYWVRVELDRSTTGEVVIIHSVAVMLAFG